MDKKLTEKFTSFVRSYEGAEIIDDLSLTPDQKAAQKADYFFNGRTIIAEQKSLEIDTAHKMEAILKPYEGTSELRNISKIELFKYGLRSSSEMEDMLCTEPKEKLTPELMDEVGRKFTYFLEEMNFRGIDMREFEKFHVNVCGQS